MAGAPASPHCPRIYPDLIPAPGIYLEKMPCNPKNNRDVKKGNQDQKKHSGGQATFRHYKVMVKILQDDKVDFQNLEIFTTGLPQLLELRRIHNKTFAELALSDVSGTCRQN